MISVSLSTLRRGAFCSLSFYARPRSSMTKVSVVKKIN